MPFPPQLQNHATNIDNAFAARLRVLQRRKLTWDWARLRDALVAWSGGLLAPAEIAATPFAPAYPIAYIETAGDTNTVIVVTEHGVHVADSEALGLRATPVQQFIPTAQALADAVELNTRLDMPVEAVSTSTTTFISRPIVHKNDDAWLRYPCGRWSLVRESPDAVPDFPDLSTSLTWLQRCLTSTGRVSASQLFGVITTYPAWTQWLNTTEAWKLFTQTVNATVEDVDQVSHNNVELPCQEPFFREWLFEYGSVGTGNDKTFLQWALSGELPVLREKHAHHKLAKLITAWEKDDVSALRQAMSQLRTPYGLLPLLCEHRTASSQLRDYMWQALYDVRAPLPDLVAITRAVTAKTPELLPDARWFLAARFAINYQGASAADFPDTWFDALLENELTNGSLIAPRKLIGVVTPKLQALPDDARAVLLARVLAQLTKDDLQSDDLNDVYTMCKTCFPGNDWSSLHALDADCTQYLFTVQRLRASPQPAVTLPDAGLDEFTI